MQNTIVEMIRDVFNEYRFKNPDKIDKVYSYCSRETILNLVTWVGELKDFNSKDYEEFFKQKYMREVQENSEREIEMNKKTYEMEIEMNKKTYEMEIEMHKKYNDQLKEYYDQLKRVIEYTHDNNIKNSKNYSSTSIGNEGENKVYQALLENQRYPSLKIEDVSHKQGCGDLNVYLPEHDLSLLIEVKNWKKSISSVDIERFTCNYNTYFAENRRSHAMMLSVGSNGFAGIGDFDVKKVNIDNNKHLVMYYSNANMSYCDINHNFNYFIDRIISLYKENSDNSNNNEYLLCSSINETLQNLYIQRTELQENKNQCIKQIKYIDTQLKKVNDDIINKQTILTNYNYSYDVGLSDVSRIINILKKDNICLDNFEEFKGTFKYEYNSISNFIKNNNVIGYLSKKGIKYADLYDYIMKYT